MSDILLVLDQPYEQAIAWIDQQFSDAGFQVIHTFDLRNAQHAMASCPCPNHATDRCDCQLGVLLVYAQAFQPASLVAHSHDGRTWISLVDTQLMMVDPRLEMAIRQLLTEDQPQCNSQAALHPIISRQPNTVPERTDWRE